MYHGTYRVLPNCKLIKTVLRHYSLVNFIHAKKFTIITVLLARGSMSAKYQVCSYN